MEQKTKTKKKEALPDEDIVALYWQREERAISETDNKYGSYLYTIAYNVLSDRLDSEECLDDTYLGAWNSMPPKRPTALAVFLSRIMRNVALSRFRRKTAEKRVPSELVRSLDELADCLACEDVSEDYDKKELARVLNEYLRSLSDRQAFVFICRYYYFDKVEKIADMLKLSRNTVTRDLAAIRAGLKARLDEEGISL